jgi:hypothetical protein
MTHKYGVFQSSSKSCVFYKEDKDGNQSTFNIFVTPKEHEKDAEKVIAFIDNEQMKKENWAKTEVTDIKDIIEAFGGWATDAPIVFELEAHKSLSNCLRTVLKKEKD